VAILAIFALWLLWPSGQGPPDVRAASTAGLAPAPKQEKAPKPAVAPRKAPPAVRTAQVSFAPDRERLLQAIRERSRELAACPLPPGSPPVLPTRLHMTKSGEVQSLRFATPVPLPETLAACARSKIAAWKFSDLDLKSDIQILVSFELGRP
jgi:hypothetical protein